MKQSLKVSLFYLFILLLFAGCSKEYIKNPTDDFIKKLEKDKTYSVILYDIDIEGNYSKDYKHQYKIIYENETQTADSLTAWYKVPEDFFWLNENNVGMEIISKSEDGKISKIAAPAGFTNYVGNEKYGQWKQDASGTSFWEFYGQFAFMSMLFNTFATPINRGGFDNYNNGYRNKQPYYGQQSASGKTTYGTYSTTTEKTKPSSFNQKFERIKQNSFQRKVDNKVNRSSGRSTSPGVRSRGGK